MVSLAVVRTTKYKLHLVQFLEETTIQLAMIAQ